MSKKKEFLRFMADHHMQWFSNKELVDRFGWSINQRKNEMNKAGIRFESRQCKDPGKYSKWEYRLVTPPHRIDFEKCRLKPEYRQAQRNPAEILKATMQVSVREDKNGQFAIVF